MDPLLTAFGIELAAGTALDAGRAVASALLGWAVKSDEVTRLFLELDERFGSVPGLSATGLEPLRRDPEFLQLLAAFWSTAVLPRDEMIAAIEPHVGSTQTQTPRQVAEQITDAIDLFSARARSDNKELFAIEAFRQSVDAQIEALRQELRATVAPPIIRHVTVDWAPPLTQARLKRMLESGASDLAPLEATLRDLEDPRQAIKGLVARPPEWLEGASHKTWTALGEIANDYALWGEASFVFERAAGMPGADRAMLTARAASTARLGGDEERFQRLLDDAIALDAGHAQVVLAQLDASASAEERLALLESAPKQPDERRQAALDVARAVALMDAGRWDEAEQFVQAVRVAVADHVGLRELEPALVIGRNRNLAGQGLAVDVAALRKASEQLLELRADVLSAFRFGEGGRLLARAIIALALAGDLRDAVALVDELRDEEKADRIAAVELVEAVMSAEDPELARSLAPEDPQSEREELAAAHSAAFSNDLQATLDAVPVLDRLLGSSDEAIRGEAAFAREVAALDPAIDSNPTARALIVQEAPSLAALLAAERLHRAGDEDQAEAVLLPHQDDVRVLRALARWAGLKEQWDRVLELSRAIASKQPAPLDRLIFADVLQRTGEHQEALTELTNLRRDENAAREIRNEAYALSARISSETFDFPGLERIAREWLAFDESQKTAAWNRVYALLRLARPAEALAVIEQLSLEPQNVGQAELFAAVLDESADLESAARRIGELSDRFGRPERLEAQFLMVALRVRPEDRLLDLREQIQERLASFPERFPDSELIRSVAIDTSSPEGIDKFFREHIEPGAEHVQQTGVAVRSGEAPIAALAAVVGKPVSLVTLQLDQAMPLGFRNPTLDELEQESASQAVTRAVIWDPIALAIVASLPRETSELLRTAFPASITSQATVDDLNRARENPSMEREQYGVIGYDAASGQRFFRDRPPEEIAAERDAIARAVEIAQTLQVRPDVDPARANEIDQLLLEEDRNAAFATFPASISLAQRNGKPLYSDDRYVRVQARRFGIASFGTLAALEVLTQRGLISDDQRLEARAALRRRGAMGVGATLEELISEARSAGWSLSEGIAFSLLDPTAWIPNAVEIFRIWGAFLAAVFEEAPERLDVWVCRFLDAAARNMPDRSYGFLAETLLLIAWRPFNQTQRSFLHALIRALRNARHLFGWYADPVNGTARRLSTMSKQSEPREVRGVLMQSFWRDLDLDDQLRLMGVQLPWRW